MADEWNRNAKCRHGRRNSYTSDETQSREFESVGDYISKPSYDSVIANTQFVTFWINEIIQFFSSNPGIVAVNLRSMRATFLFFCHAVLQP